VTPEETYIEMRKVAGLGTVARTILRAGKHAPGFRASKRLGQYIRQRRWQKRARRPNPDAVGGPTHTRLRQAISSGQTRRVGPGLSPSAHSAQTWTKPDIPRWAVRPRPAPDANLRRQAMARDQVNVNKTYQAQQRKWGAPRRASSLPQARVVPSRQVRSAIPAAPLGGTGQWARQLSLSKANRAAQVRAGAFDPTGTHTIPGFKVPKQVTNPKIVTASVTPALLQLFLRSSWRFA
jgi:hypothetical protein